MHSTLGVTHSGDRLAQVKLASVLRRLSAGILMDKLDPQIAQGLVAAEWHFRADTLARSQAGTAEVGVDEFLSFGVFPFEQETTNLRQRRGSVGTIRILG